jgi:hypothetical protein
MEGKAIFFWVFLAAGGLAFALYIIVNMHSHGRACFGRRKKPSDIEHGHALSNSSADRKASAATLVNDPPLKNASEANSQPENQPTNMTETNGQSDTTPTTVTETNAQPENETNAQPENETKRKPRRFGGKEDLTPLRLAKRRFGGTEDLPLRLANQTRGTANQSLQSARITRLERDGEEGDLGTRMPPWSAT